MSTHFRLSALAAALATTTLLSACGGGGGGSTANNSGNYAANGTPIGGQNTAPPPGVQATPTYAAGSTEAAMFARINYWRQQCGFPAVQQDTLLDQSAANHAQYMTLNGNQVTDDEVQGNPGFTGVTYQDRAVYVGYPQSLPVGGGSDEWSNYDYQTQQAGTLTNTQMGQALIDEFLSGVYHQFLITSPYLYAGVGVASTQKNGSPVDFAAVSISGLASNFPASSTPLTFPCQGVSGVPYWTGNGELPHPPNTSPDGFGTPVSAVGNAWDQVQITQATITGPQGSVAVQILNSNTDPNQDLPAYMAVVYPTSPLQPNTAYRVMLQGTINGQPFTRNFSFTTGTL